MRKLFLFAFIVALVSVGCKRAAEDDFSFSLSTRSVTEGERLPVGISLRSGSASSYSMSASVNAYDLSTGAISGAGFQLVDENGNVAGTSIDFSSAREEDLYVDGRLAGTCRKLNFFVDGLSSGTYLVKVSLTRGDKMHERSSVVVVLEKSGGGGGGKPERPADVAVESFYFEGMEMSGGALNLELDRTYRFPVRWTPSDATLIDFSARSTNPDVVDVTISGYVLTISPKKAGVAELVISVDRGPEVVVPVLVKERVVDIESFDISGIELTDGRLLMDDNDAMEYPVSWKPADANPVDISASSSDEDIVEAVMLPDDVDGLCVLTLFAKYPGDAIVTVSTDNGISQRIPVRVHKDVVVEVFWYEPNATDIQIRTKTFPCYLMFKSDSDKAFPTPVTWTVTMKGVVGVTGQDTQSVTSKKDVKFYGNKSSQYDVTSNVLIPCYSIYRTDSFSLKLTLTLQRNAFFDPNYWSVNFKETYKDQDARIQEYITYAQQ